MKPRPLLIAGVLGGLLTLVTPVMAAADDDTSTLEVTVAGGELEISVKTETRDLGTVQNTSDGTIISGTLGMVTVRDNRNAAAGSSWVATAVATELRPKKGHGISAVNIQYRAGPVDKQGNCTIRASKAVTLSRSRAVVTATEISGNNTASWTPRITVSIPAGVVSGTYKGVITHSVL
jgi:hypothetical protein